jgi:transcriptional regulator with XRE-family HTH domain
MNIVGEKMDEQRTQMAKRLRDAREYLGLSQDDVAGALGISRPAVTNIESGARKVEALELDKLAKLYGRPVQFLLTGEEPVAGDEGIHFLARAIHGLSEHDLDEVSRFAEFLKRSPKQGVRGDR